MIDLLGEIRHLLCKEPITVTDLPVYNEQGDFVRYNYLYDEDKEAMRNVFQAGVKAGVKADQKLIYWQELAREVTRNKYARCHGCTAYAAAKIDESGFCRRNNLHIWICGRGDHFFLILSNRGGIVPNSGNNNVNIFDPDDIVVDLWNYRVYKQKSGLEDVGILALRVKDWNFINEAIDIRIFVRFN